MVSSINKLLMIPFASFLGQGTEVALITSSPAWKRPSVFARKVYLAIS